MRGLLSTLLLAVCAARPLAADTMSHASHTAGAMPDSAAPRFDHLGPLHHVVSTRNAQAQRWFDQGLSLCWAFNHDEAVRSFEHAARLDPALAMAHWGIAFACGPNINLPMDADHETRALAEITTAKQLASHASASDRAYIDALATRYGAPAGAERAARDSAYTNALQALRRQFPNDADATVLWAESAMDLRPWQYWQPDGSPAPGTEAFVEALEGVLLRQPDHIGANHLLIHAVEASPHPERASAAAERLKTLSPDAGHLMHMPTHIEARLGDWVDSATRNEAAAAIDSAYITAHHIGGIYPLMYYNHNLHFAAFSWTVAGNYARAIPLARVVSANADAAVRDMPMLEVFTPTALLVETRFRKWGAVAATPKPAADLRATCGYWHYAQGMRLAFAGRADSATVHLDSLRAIAPDFAPDFLLGFNPASSVLGVAEAQLAARIAEARGRMDDAIAGWRTAVAREDSLGYDEPPDWYLFSRESLGGALMRAGRTAEAVPVFERELVIHPHSPRALLALKGAYDAAGRREDAMRVDREFQGAMHSMDTDLFIRDY